jgi:hypothetical protein
MALPLLLLIGIALRIYSGLNVTAYLAERTLEQEKKCFHVFVGSASLSRFKALDSCGVAVIAQAGRDVALPSITLMAQTANVALGAMAADRDDSRTFP